jgi:hypothetical protein
MELMLMVAIASLLFVLGSWWYFSREPKRKKD